MKLKPFKLVPVVVAFSVIAAVGLARWGEWEFFERLERMTFDMRARQALGFAAPSATNLGFVFIDEDSVRQVWNGSLGFSYGLNWPRRVYGHLVNELAAQGARAIAFDVVLGELRPDHPPFFDGEGGTNLVESDDFFAEQMRRAGNVIIAQSKDVVPPALFRTNVLATGDITTEKDPDGVLRRVQILGRDWHPVFRQAATELNLDLGHARVEPRRIIIPLAGTPPPGETTFTVPLDENGNFDLADFAGENLPPHLARMNRPFTGKWIWHMGVVLAARELGLDLDGAEVDLARGRITLHGAEGVRRTIPVDDFGYAYIDWRLPPNHPLLTQESIQDLLAQNLLRREGRAEGLTNRWRGKLAVVGSAAVVGNNLTDRGATPLDKDTLLVSKHWNVANSLLMGRFVRRTPLAFDLGVIALLGLLAGIATWQMRILLASSTVVLLILAYVGFTVILYAQTRLWAPIVLPVGGAVLVTHLLLVTWRVVFEQAEQRHIRSVFATMVSPKIAQELLRSEHLALGGERREITVLFADVRGFTQFTDQSQEQVAEFVRQNGLSGAEAEACFNEQARETLETINLYLGVVADTVLKQDGTLDKFIGDCVMAFWGAPTPNPEHAVACVRAALDAQRAIYELNRQRAEENRRRAEENVARIAAGLRPKPALPILFLGSGINTGFATAGLMGSEVKTVARKIVRQANYTVFGREVNLASRLEGASGRGRIFIGKTTYEHLLRLDPALAATCVLMPEQRLKGISTAVTVYEVPWRPPGLPPLEEEFGTRQGGVPDTETTIRKA